MREPETAGLMPEQLSAFCKLTGMLRAGAPVVKLAGYAGTGKTHLTARIAAWAKRAGFDVTLAAPTHKALSVLRGKVGGDFELRTIHSLLGLMLKPDLHADTGGHILVSNRDARITGGLVITDESSMVGKILTGHVGDGGGAQWLFVGDPAQLPPVGEEPSELLTSPDAMLRHVVRQAEGSEIIRLATRVRSGDLSLRFAPGREVIGAEDRGDLFAMARERFESAEYAADPSFARVLTYRNALRQAFNRAMREELLGDVEPYCPGEWLVMYAPYTADAEDDEAPRLHTSQEVKVVGARLEQVDRGRWTFETWVVDVEADGEAFALPVVAEESEADFQKAKDWLAWKAKEARNRGREEERRQWWERFFDLDGAFAKVDRAYAMTVHKAQGSTFGHAFVDAIDIMQGNPVMQPLLYTAVTRPSQTLTLVR